MTIGLKLRRKLSGKAATVSATVLAVVFAVVGIAAVVVHLHQRYTSTGLYRMEYEGKILDKSATISESDMGSRVSWRLRIRKKNGEEFQVTVNQSLYERAQIGMWIKSSSEKAELSWEEP